MARDNMFRSDVPLVSTRLTDGIEYVAMAHASRDIELLLALIKMMIEATDERPDPCDMTIIDQIAADYGVPRWNSDY